MNIVGITGDTHFGHSNIILYANRPFVNRDTDLNDHGKWKNRDIANQRAREMDEDLIRGCNSVVKQPDDVIVHLGDFSFGNAEYYVNRLNGQIWFVTGNHDKQMLDFLKTKPDKVRHLGNLAEIYINGWTAVLCHFAMRVWNKSHYGNIHLYGHSHGSLDEPESMLSMDVGVDCAKKRLGEYRPFKPDEIIKVMSKRTFKPVDHHKRN